MIMVCYLPEDIKRKNNWAVCHPPERYEARKQWLQRENETEVRNVTINKWAQQDTAFKAAELTCFFLLFQLGSADK